MLARHGAHPAAATRDAPPPDWLVEVAPNHHRFLLESILGELELHCVANPDGTSDYWLEPLNGTGFLRYRGTTELDFSTALAKHVETYRRRESGPPPRAADRFS